MMMNDDKENSAGNVNKWYTRSTRFLRPSTISVIIALLSGVAINLLTNETSNSRYSVPIISLSLAVLSLLILWQIIENFHDSFAKKLNDQMRKTKAAHESSDIFFAKSDEDLWVNVISKKRGQYLSLLLLAIVSVVVSIVCIVITNNAIVSEAKQEKDILQSTLTKISDQVVAIQTKVITQETEIKKMSESIQQISTPGESTKDGKSQQGQ